MERWQATIAWAENNGCAGLVAGIPDHDFYFTSNPSDYPIGPMGGPMYRPWDFEKKDRPVQEQLTGYFSLLSSNWSEIVGQELASMTRPLEFTGKKARRLLVLADGNAAPSWGGWSRLSAQESERRTFTRFRAAINAAIAPHEVDHIDFTTESNSERGTVGNDLSQSPY